MEHILLPTTIEFSSTDDRNTGVVLMTPCRQGYGTTIGNALRRVLLSSLPGAAVETVKINGVQHEFSSLEGVHEDVVEIILNVKQIAVKSYADQPVVLQLKKKGIGDVTAADFEKNSDIEIVNPELKLATITSDKMSFEMEVTIGRGSGYVPASEKNTKDFDLGTIAIDSLYTPIRDVGYNVENTRVGDVTDYEKLTLTVQTNGTIEPKDAVSQATRILMDHFRLLLAVAEEGEMDIPAPVVAEESVEDETEAVEEAPAKKTRKKKA